MAVALAEASKAADLGEVPIGAIVVYHQQIIARAYNLRETSQDATDHAEILAIRTACRAIGSWRLEECQLFVTLEPCPMCAGAIINSRIQAVYYGAADPKAGAVESLAQLLTDSNFNHQPQIFSGIKADESRVLLQQFFRTIRTRQKAKKKNLQQNKD